MSKRKFLAFLEELDAKELRGQLLDLYLRYSEVKEYYNFSFHPDEENRFRKAKQKIRKEYFPDEDKKPKRRRSVAQKLILHFLKLEADPVRIADLSLYNIEVAQAAYANKPIKQKAFFKSILKSFRHSLVYIQSQLLKDEFEDRVDQIVAHTHIFDWPNSEDFSQALKQLWHTE